MAEKVLLFCSLGLSSSLPACSVPTEVLGQGGVRCEGRGSGSLNKTERALCKGRCKTTGKTCQRSPQGHKAQKKKAGGIGGTVKSPDETRIPDGHHPQIAYILRERSGGKQYSSNANVILASETVSDTPELSTRLYKDSHFKIRMFSFTAESSSVSEKSRCSRFSWICTW